MLYLKYLLVSIAVFILVTVFYRLLSKGLSRSAKGQQLTRFGVASVLAVLPYAIAGEVGWNLSLSLVVAVSALWMLVFPVLDYVANRGKRPEIDNRMDFAFGLYLAGFLSGCYIGLTSLLPGWDAIISTALAAVEVPILVLAAFQIAYYMIYRAALDHDGLKLVLDTDANEVLEFVRSFPLWAVIVGLVGMILFLMAWFFWNLSEPLQLPDINWARRIGLVVYSIGVGCLMFRGGHSAFRRSGLPRLYFEDKEHARECAGYAAACHLRREALRLSSPLLDAKPSGKTYVLVIGESASRDYMEAFNPKADNRGTTPWLAQMAREGSAILFPMAYSCHFQTVPTLTRALTGMNQYAPGVFNDSVSVVDIANKLGMKVYWFSNQGHIGVNDTAVTLIADTADRAVWTSQSLSRRNYDGELPAFLEQVDPAADKLVVFHLMGSHFTYSNRYPAEAAYFDEKGGGDAGGYLPSYRNSLRYTDSVLEEIYNYASRHLNLQAMVYCSDHGDMPDRRRSPVFDGFGKLRIPLTVIPGAGYSEQFPEVVATLRRNSGYPFSNDLLFNLVCGLWKVESVHTPAELNIASDSYSLRPETTLVLLGESRVSDDRHGMNFSAK